MPWGHSNPTYSLRDDVGKVIGKHTLQFGAQYVYSQRNQNNNAIGAVSGDEQGLLTFSNLAHSTGNAFADFLVDDPESAQKSPGIHSEFYAGFLEAALLPAFSDSRALYSGRLQGNSQFDSESWLAYQFVWHLQREKPQCMELGGSRFNASRFGVDPFMVSFSIRPPAPFRCHLIPSLSNWILASSATWAWFDADKRHPRSCMKGHLFNPAPRIGFAWDPRGDGKTSIRGGYGISLSTAPGTKRIPVPSRRAPRSS